MLIGVLGRIPGSGVRLNLIRIFGNHCLMMESNKPEPMSDIVKRLRKQAMLALILGVSLSPAITQAQRNPDSVSNPLYGSVTITPRVASVLPLSLDDAIRRGLEHNLQIALAAQDVKTASGQRLKASNYLLPTLTWQAERSRRQFNLEAQGFRATLLATFPPGLIPPSVIDNFQPRVTANVVAAQANLTQTLFDLHAFELYRAANQEISAADYNLQSARGAVIQTVGESYLLALADAANVDNARELLKTNAELLRQAELKHEAGSAPKLDELRARVEYQQQEQILIARQNEFEKAKVGLNREIGLAIDQAIRLTDETPYAGLEMMPLDEALREAYRNRQAYLHLQARLRSAELQRRAARYERLPTLSFQGNYGMTGTVGGIYHGTFLAQGTLNIPVFQEGKFRGDREVADAATHAAMAQLANFKSQIEAEVRSSMLDVTATEELVNVASSKVNLARSTLDDAILRFKNGIDDNLPVVEAQSSLATAQTEMVSSLYQYDKAKLALARSIGIIENQYRTYLGPATLAAVSDRKGRLRRASLPPAE